jgi:hypothetical protein
LPHGFISDDFLKKDFSSVTGFKMKVSYRVTARHSHVTGRGDPAMMITLQLPRMSRAFPVNF